MPIKFDEKNQFFHLYNNKISYIIGIEKEKYLTHLYYGRRLESYHKVNKLQTIDRGFSTNPIAKERTFSLNTLPLETSSEGSLDFRISNFKFRNTDGFTITQFEYHSYQIYEGKHQLNGLPSINGESHCTSLEITLLDHQQQLKMILKYSIFKDLPIITRSIEYYNAGSKPIYLENAGSMSLDFTRNNFDILTLYGAHTNEATIQRTPLHAGIQKITSNRGTSSPQHQPFIALLDSSTTEHSGEAFAFHFIYSGNFVAQVEVEQYGSSRIQIGINPDTFEWMLSPNSSFQTPEVVLNYAKDGLNELSQTFHNLYQYHLIAPQWQRTERPILLNSWEGNYFDFSEKDLLEQADLAKSLGIELFVLDDGWFGERQNDTSSLGDWYPNLNKLPNGINGLASAIKKKGLKFGLWFEPEMISVNSQLFKNHSDWCLQVPNYPNTEGRQQLVLDLSRTDVQDYLITTLDSFLKANNIDYIKWDMNRHLTEVGSSYSMQGQSQKEVSHRYVLGLYHILETITTRYPDVLFENCSSGGGRFDPGMIAYMPQTWTSDNSDALCRSKIQSGYSLLYPPIMMGAHVSDIPNHQVGRMTPLETRFLIAMSGNFGYELNIQKQSPETLLAIKKQVYFYKKHRDLIQFGEFYRLKSPNNDLTSAWLFKNDHEALLIYSHGLAQPAQQVNYLPTSYLDDQKMYQDSTTKEIFSGSELNYAGILIPRIKEDFSAFYRHWKII